MSTDTAMCGSFFRLLEIINDGLGIGVVANDPLGEAAPVLGVQLIEPLQNKLRVAFVLGKQDCFPQTVAARHLDPPVHQVLQYDVHGGFVEHKFIEGSRGDKVWQLTVFDEIILISLFVLFGQIIIGDAFFQKRVLTS